MMFGSYNRSLTQSMHLYKYILNHSFNYSFIHSSIERKKRLKSNFWLTSRDKGKVGCNKTGLTAMSVIIYEATHGNTLAMH